MKICHTEAMKLIKEYEEQKRVLLDKEDENSTVSYKEGEEKMKGDYDYGAVREQIKELDDRVRALRVALARVNCTVIVEGFGITIGEALVRLAQLQGERAEIEGLARRRQLSRRITANGVLEYTECLYDVEQAKTDAQALRKVISDLQMAIDRANLTNYVEV